MWNAIGLYPNAGQAFYYVGSPVFTRARIDLAKRLLVETDLKMPVIAKRSGFPDASHLGVVFRRQTGLTLTAFRNQSRIVS